MKSLDQILAEYEVVDLTHRIEEGMPEYLPYVHIVWESSKLGDEYNAYAMYITEHHGTHVDATSHIDPLGGLSLHEMPLDTWYGPCCLIDMTWKKPREFVTIAEIEDWEKRYSKIRRDEIVIINYGWYKKWSVRSYNNPRSGLPEFFKDFPGLSKEAAEYIGKKGVKLVGADTPTVDAAPAFEEAAMGKGKVEPAHKALIVDNGVALIENLTNLDKLPPRGSYLMALPWNIKDGTGSPVRAIAFVPKR